MRLSMNDEITPRHRDLPPDGLPVLVFVEDELPFVGYYDSATEEWRMETGILNADTHRDDVFGHIVGWMTLPEVG